MNKRAQTAGTAPTTSSRKKALWIALIAGVIVLLIVLFFAGRQLVGKAITLPGGTFTVNQGGAVGSLPLPKAAGTEFEVVVGANIGNDDTDNTKTVGYEFVLQYPNAILEVVSVTSSTGWNDPDTEPPENLPFLRQTNPASNQVKFEEATIDYTQALTGAVELARVRFRVLSGQTFSDANELTFLSSEFKVWSLSTNPQPLITSVRNPSGTTGVTAETVTEFCNDNQAACVTICQGIPGVCVDGEINADLNNDGLITNDDVTIMQLALEAKDPNIEPQTDCGGVNQPLGSEQSYCNFDDLIWICEDLKNSLTQPTADC